jgi:cytochrome d ubiquinol oxidase subunit I
MDLVWLSRIQFAFTVSFHYLFPPLSIGLALMIAIMEGIYLKTKNPKYKQMTKFWTSLFALSFALGVATGIVQVFAFGNNWSRYSTFVGDVFGSALAAEGIFAFFLEGGFIGVMLFGWGRVSEKMHYLSTILVTIGSHFSAVWIVAANSWMQTPAGFKIMGTGDQARAVVTNFWEMIFNPSFLVRITHVILGAWLTGAFVVLSISAYYYLRKRDLDFAKSSMKIGLYVAGIVLLLQLWSADSTARNVATHQPAKLAAIEGIYKTQEYSPLTLVGYVDSKTQQVKGIQVPGLLSFLVSRNFKEPVKGLDQIPKENWPNVPVIFQSYHLMIAMWGLMALGAALAILFYRKGTLAQSKWTLRYLIISALFPYFANQAGWFTAEVGRQPWIVYNILRTVDGVSKSIVAGQVVGSLIMFILIYALLFFLFIFLMNRKIQAGPRAVDYDREYRNIYEEVK